MLKFLIRQSLHTKLHGELIELTASLSV